MSGEIAFRVRGRIGAIFLARHAIAPEDAIAFSPEARDVREFARLRVARVVRDVGDGRCWFDLPAYFARADAVSRKAVVVSVIVALVGAVVAVLSYRG